MTRVSLKGALADLDLQSPPLSDANEPELTASHVDEPATAPPGRIEPAEPEPDSSRRPARRATRAKEAGPKYLALVRKEARLREDQVDDLSTQARRLMRNRPASSGERITDNTLIRVAVDLLLARADQLTGADEAALRKSVGL